VGAGRVARERTVSPPACRQAGSGAQKHLIRMSVWGRTQGSRLRQTPSAATARQARPGLDCAAPCLPAGRLRGFKQIEERCCQAPDGVGTGSGWRYKMRGGWARQNETRAKSRSLPPRRAGTSVRDPPSPRLRRGRPAFARASARQEAAAGRRDDNFTDRGKAPPFVRRGGQRMGHPLRATP